MTGVQTCALPIWSILPLPVNRRPFNTVFQDYALFPHMTVAGNVRFGLSVRGLSRSEIGRRTAEVLALVAMDHLAERYPVQLSGGQKQRVALARALVCEPQVVLLDEPFAALDVSLRRQMQGFLKEIQRRVATTFFFITHDQEEAIALGDRICVMGEGCVLQAGPPRDLYDRPVSATVARFFGDNNLIPGRIVAHDGVRVWVETALGRMSAGCLAGDIGAAVAVAIRPEKLRLVPVGEGVAGRMGPATYGGAISQIAVETAAGRLHIKSLSPQNLPDEGAEKIGRAHV